MDKIEYWFLDAAIRQKIPFDWLSAGNVDELLNRPHHSLSQPELLAVLERMFARGDLFLEYMNLRGQSSRTQAPSGDELQRALFSVRDPWLGQPERVLYGVTSQGGALWETHSQPKWEYFFEEGYGADPDEGEMSAQTRELIEERLALIPFDSFVKDIVSGSIRWSVLQPWEATYWKRLPLGYHVEFTYLPLTEAEKLARSDPENRMHEWYRRLGRWYAGYAGPEV